jgi:carbamoyl-phosphate synthase large subunit
MGGQTGLNLAKTMAESGLLDKYGVELIGAKLPSIDRAEDRELFKQAMVRIGLKTPPRCVCVCRNGCVGGGGGGGGAT